MLTLVIFSSLLAIATSDEPVQNPTPDQVLMLGGQGLAGSATLKALLDASFHVTLLNDDKNYYDYHTLLDEGNTEKIVCNRAAGLESCFEFQDFMSKHEKVRAVVDFTSSTKELMEEAVRAVGVLSPEVYIFVSSAAVYDVSADPVAPVSETDGVRAEDPDIRETHSAQNEFGDKMLAAEEELIASGLPYVIVRCGDLIGPRDTTYRWWQYQMWAEHFPSLDIPFPVPNDLYETQFSLTYGADVGQAVVSTIKLNKINAVYNIAIDKVFTLPHLLLEMCIYFGTNEKCYADYTDAAETYNLYPSSHVGIMDLQRAKTELEFVPSTWETVLTTTVQFYEEAREKFTVERNLVLTRLNENAMPYSAMETLNEAVLNIGNKVDVTEQQEQRKSEL